MTDDAAPPAPTKDRTPPHDINAEQCVLGGMLLSPDAIAEVTDTLTPDDFYRPTHATIYNAICRIFSSGDPADPVTLANHLAATGDLARIGGAAYLHTLIATIPTVANTGYYAQIVAEKAGYRRLLYVGDRIHLIAHSGMSLPDAQDAIGQAFYEATTGRKSNDIVRIGDLLESTREAIRAAASRDGLQGLSTGLSDLDRVTHGLCPGHLWVVAGRPGMGKALALDTPLATPTGWTTMGEVQVGDQLIDANGRPTRVVAATEIMHGRPCYEVRFSDGSAIVADAEHQWLTETRAARVSATMVDAPWSRVRTRRTGPTVKTTEEIAATVRCRTADARLNHAVALTRPLDLPAAELPIDPYVLGAWLGDGHSYSGSFTCADPEIVLEIEGAGYNVTNRAAKYAYGIRGLRAQLRHAGLLRNKHVPDIYLRSSIQQRRDLLAGLLDTDGSVANNGGSVRFEVTNRRLAGDVHELILSLGYRCAMTTKRVPGHTEASSTCYRLTFTPREKVFRLSRKAARQTLGQTSRATCRYITEVRPVPSQPVRCVQVDNDDHLYLAGRSMIPTHNSVFGADLARSVALHQKRPVLFFTLEMTREELMLRFTAAEARVPLDRLQRGGMTADDWSRVDHCYDQIQEAPLFMGDGAETTMMQIRSTTRRIAAQEGDLGLVVVDYLQLMPTINTGRNQNRERDVAELSRGMKLLAKELRVPVVALSQLNRNVESRQDKRPTGADLRESGSIEQDSDVIVLLFRDDYYDHESARAGEVDLIVDKNRHGPKDTVTVAAQLHFSRFVDMAI